MIEALENDFVHDGSFYEFDSAAKQKAASFLAALDLFELKLALRSIG